MSEATGQNAKTPRKQARGARRQQLIEATLWSLATHGYARTTLNVVARRAGISHGLVIFHFESKESLLTETLRYLADEYRQNWSEALRSAGDQSTAGRLEALLLADFEPTICTPERLAAWCSFWGEAQSRPLYQDNCGSNDEEYSRVVETLCADLIAEAGYSGDPVRIARVLRVTIEGVWLDLMTMRAPYSRDEALATVMTCASAFFPRHFSPSGRVG